jgi:hypothetical protein
MQKHIPRINVNPEKSDGTYSNLVMVAFSRAEFVLDFARIMPGAPAASLKARVIMSPHAAKAFAEQLVKQIKTYEEKNGALADTREQNAIGFITPGNEDRTDQD